MMLSMGGRVKNLRQIVSPEPSDGVIALPITLLSGGHDHESALFYTRHLPIKCCGFRGGYLVVCEHNQEQFRPYFFQIGSRVVIARGIVVIKGIVGVGMFSRKFDSAVIPFIGRCSCGIVLILSGWFSGHYWHERGEPYQTVRLLLVLTILPLWVLTHYLYDHLPP